MKKKFLFLLLLAMVGTLFAKEIKIGIVLPMSGPIGGFGQSAYKGIKLAHKLEPKLKNGDTLKLVLVDNKSDKIESANAISKLISNDKVTAIIGALTSSNTMAGTKIAEDNKTPMVAPVATNVKITKKKKFISRVCFSDAFQGVVASNFAYNNLKARRVAIIIDTKQDYSIGIAKQFRKAFKKLGGKIIQKAKISSGDTDFKAIISNLKSLKPDLVFIPIYSTEAALIAKQAKELGFKTKFLGTDGMAADKVFFETGKDAVEGFYNTDLYSPKAPQTTQLSKKFIKEYKKEYNEDIHPFAALSADAYYIIVNAMNKCKNPEDKICVNKNIRATKNFEGVSGIITLKNGDAIRSAVINQVKNGKLEYKAVVKPNFK